MLQLALTPALSRKRERGRAAHFICRRAVAAAADRGRLRALAAVNDRGPLRAGIVAAVADRGRSPRLAAVSDRGYSSARV